MTAPLPLVWALIGASAGLLATPRNGAELVPALTMLAGALVGSLLHVLRERRSSRRW